MSEKYKVGESTIPHFITITVIDWVDLLTRPVYKDLILNSFDYCIKNKGLELHAYVVMTSHIHAVVSSNKAELNEIIRDFKKFTSKKLIEAIIEINESRREWLLKKFEFAAKRIKRGGRYKIWQDGFHPVQLSSNKMLDQKIEYIHNNPVEEGIVYRGSEYVYSSAGVYEGLYDEKVALQDLSRPTGCLYK